MKNLEFIGRQIAIHVLYYYKLYAFTFKIKEAFPLKYWRGYLVAGILGLFTWGLMEFAKTHQNLIDMIYPYVTRMIQTALASWSGGVDFLLWQFLAIVLVVLLLATIVLMVVLRRCLRQPGVPAAHRRLRPEPVCRFHRRGHPDGCGGLHRY